VPSPQKSRRLLLIKPAELLLFSTGADNYGVLLRNQEQWAEYRLEKQLPF
jgi:hypothetical protein